MQPLMCAGGFPMPIKKGRFEIYAILATIDDTTVESRITLIDSEDFKIVPDSNDMQYKDSRRMIFDMKGLANADGCIGMVFPEPIKVIKGISLNSLSNNLTAGKTFVYTR